MRIVTNQLAAPTQRRSKNKAAGDPGCIEPARKRFVLENNEGIVRAHIGDRIMFIRPNEISINFTC